MYVRLMVAERCVGHWEAVRIMPAAASDCHAFCIFPVDWYMSGRHLWQRATVRGSETLHAAGACRFSRKQSSAAQSSRQAGGSCFRCGLQVGTGVRNIRWGVNASFPDTKCFIVHRADGTEEGFRSAPPCRYNATCHVAGSRQSSMPHGRTYHVAIHWTT